MPEDLMRYDLLAQEALRGVVRAALRKIMRGGLPGDHHFYVAFDTRYPGVGMSDRLRERYPKEMTIVLQHQFWNLAVHEEGFEVELQNGVLNLVFEEPGEARFVVSPNAPVQSLERPSEWRTVQFWPPEAARSAANSSCGYWSMPSTPCR